MSARLRRLTTLLVVAFGCATNKPVLSVHVADYEQTTGRMRIEMPGGEAPLYAEQKPVLDQRDFSGVSLSKDSYGRPALQLCFAAEGRAEFLSIAASNRNRHLVFLVRGKLLFAPVITSETIPECLMVTGAVSADDVEVLRRAIR